MTTWEYSNETQPATWAQRRAAKRLQREIKREARFYWKRIVNRLSRMGFMFWATRRDVEGKPDGRKKQVIRAAAIHFSTEAIHYKIDTTNLPWRVRTDQLADPKILEEISLSVNRRVTCIRSLSRGTWLILERDSARTGIPTQVGYNKAFTNIPQHAPPLAVVIGVARQRELIIRDLAKMPHLLVAGATGKGKSVFVNALICTLAQRNSPDDLKFTMIDLKGGVELDIYREIPHQSNPDPEQAIIENPEHVEAALESFLAEIVHRSKKLKRGGVRDIVGWNRKHPNERLAYHVLVIDELSLVLLDRTINKGGAQGGVVTNLLARIGATGRAPGCIVVMATQRPSSDVVSPLIRANFSARVAFSTARRSDSQVIIETSHAWELEPAGRLMYRNGAELIEAQAPNLTTSGVNKIVDKLAGKKYTPRQARWQDLCVYALENLGGELPRDVLWNEFRGDISQQQITYMLHNISGQTVGLNGESFFVEPGRRGKSARLVPVIGPPVLTEAVPEGDSLARLEEWKNGGNGNHV